MFLDNRNVYLEERKKLLKMRKKELEVLLEDLYKRRFEEHDIQLDVYYRLVSQVYNSKTRKGNSLIFHLKNFVGIVVGLIITSYIRYIS